MRRVSIIIPVYNEEERIAACLEAIAVQTVRPHEVIVVDNNSTDNTVAIADRYPFVSVIRESRQGVVHARNTGFNAARGDIIGRIDADTVIDLDWVASLQQIFADDSIGATTGQVRYNDISLSSVVSRTDLFWRRRITRLLLPEMPLQGANMALRRSAWQAVRRELCNHAGLHEDFDLAIHLSRQGRLLTFDERLRASIGLRCCRSSFIDYCRYWLICPRTYAFHGVRSGRYMYPVISLLITAYLPLKLLAWSHDGGNVLKPAARRVNPATYVD